MADLLQDYWWVILLLVIFVVLYVVAGSVKGIFDLGRTIMASLMAPVKSVLGGVDEYFDGGRDGVKKLKVEKDFFDAIKSGKKTADLRIKNSFTDELAAGQKLTFYLKDDQSGGKSEIEVEITAVEHHPGMDALENADAVKAVFGRKATSEEAKAKYIKSDAGGWYKPEIIAERGLYLISFKKK